MVRSNNRSINSHSLNKQTREINNLDDHLFGLDYDNIDLMVLLCLPIEFFREYDKIDINYIYKFLKFS